MELKTGPHIFVQNVVFACSSASGMHHYFTVQLYTTWRHPGLSFSYETSLTIRSLKKERRRWIAMYWPRPVVPTRALLKVLCQAAIAINLFNAMHCFKGHFWPGHVYIVFKKYPNFIHRYQLDWDIQKNFLGSWFQLKVWAFKTLSFWSWWFAGHNVRLYEGLNDKR